MASLRLSAASVVCLLALEVPLQAQWQVQGFGSESYNSQGIYLGLGIDGQKNRLYACSGWGGDGRGYEWTYSDGDWTKEEVYSGLGVCYSPWVGAIKGPGDRRLYVGSYTNETAYEVFRDGEVWQKAPVPGSAIDKVVSVRVAPGHNDGTSRLYIAHASAGAEGGLYEFTWNAESRTWDKLRLHTRGVGEFAIADARNDGVLRIYAGSREGGDGGVIELTWDGSQYVSNLLSFPDILEGRIQTTYVGDGRGDGLKRLYANEWGGRLFELTYQDGGWSWLQVAGGASRFYMTSGRLRPDNQSRLYASLQGSGVYEYCWDGAKYVTSVDAVTSATGKPTIGSGRNDNKNRLYVGHGDRSTFPGSVAEVSDPDPPDSEMIDGAYRRGDAKADGSVDISDPISILLHLFLESPLLLRCEKSADADDNGVVELTDAIILLDFLFREGPPPSPPFEDCGVDPMVDSLLCEEFPPCR